MDWDFYCRVIQLKSQRRAEKKHLQYFPDDEYYHSSKERCRNQLMPSKYCEMEKSWVDTAPINPGFLTPSVCQLQHNTQRGWKNSGSKTK